MKNSTKETLSFSTAMKENIQQMIAQSKKATYYAPILFFISTRFDFVNAERVTQTYASISYDSTASNTGGF